MKLNNLLPLLRLYEYESLEAWQGAFCNYCIKEYKKLTLDGRAYISVERRVNSLIFDETTCSYDMVLKLPIRTEFEFFEISEARSFIAKDNAEIVTRMLHPAFLCQLLMGQTPTVRPIWHKVSRDRVSLAHEANFLGLFGAYDQRIFPGGEYTYVYFKPQFECEDSANFAKPVYFGKIDTIAIAETIDRHQNDFLLKYFIRPCTT
jgi:hypothetical protein